jgi:PLP dependent protein
MHSSIEKLSAVKNKINDILSKKQLKTNPKIIIVTKTFPINNIIPLLEIGHLHYGENKIQEAEIKWANVKNNYKNIQLHMVGGLQTNKVKKAVKLFDYIHSLDSERLALKLSECEKELNKKTKLFIQVNIAEEIQKSGILLNQLDQFYNYCTKDLSLNIIGLMCLPPKNSDSLQYFKLLKGNLDRLNLNELSVGMSADFENAILSGSTYLRLGTAIMGDR